MDTRRSVPLGQFLCKFSLGPQREEYGSMDVMDAIDLIDAHMLPFFSTQASTGE